MAEFRGCIRAAEDLLGPGARGTATMNFPNAVFMVQSIYDCMQTCLGVKICAQQKKKKINTTSDVKKHLLAKHNSSILEQRESQTKSEKT